MSRSCAGWCTDHADGACFSAPSNYGPVRGSGEPWGGLWLSYEAGEDSGPSIAFDPGDSDIWPGNLSLDQARAIIRSHDLDHDGFVNALTTLVVTAEEGSGSAS